MNNKKLQLCMAAVLLVAAVFVGKSSAKCIAEAKQAKESDCIVIDAGHGAWDPGKVGVSGSLEKDINLQIAIKLKKLLEQNDIKVVMTREEDAQLTDGSSADSKVEDMIERCDIIEEANPIFTVSIHQNSYTTEDVKGAQVFYYGQSQEGKNIASILQASLKSRLDPDNNRVEKANESYYLLKKTTNPTVIVECGFMSNPEEEKDLQEEQYQNKVAWAIYMGICVYLNSGK